MHKIGAIALVCLLSVFAAAVDVGISPTPKLQFSDVNGVPLAGGLIDTYDCGTTNPRATYSDSTGSSLNGNPVALDSGGFASIWLFGCTKMRVKNSASVVQYTIDNVNILPPWAVVTNPTNTQAISGAALTLNNNFTLLQNTVATAIANQSGFALSQNASYWNGASSGIDQWSWQVVLGTGANPTSSLVLTHTGSGGSTSITLPASVQLPNSTDSITVIANSLGSGGNLTVGAGASTGANGSGGIAGLIGGIGNGNGAGGGASVTGGVGGLTANGGAAGLIGGAGGATSGSGGAATVQAGNSGAGATGNGGAVNITAGIASSTNGNGGAVTITSGAKTGTGTAGDIILNPGRSTVLNTSVGQGSGFKHQRFGAGCATAAAVGATCNSTFTWTTTFADANYTVSCVVNSVTSGIPTISNINTKIAAGINITTAALTAAAAQAAGFDCVAAHD